MKDRQERTVDMLIHNINWQDVAKELDLTVRTLKTWRGSGDVNKYKAIDYAIDEIAKEKTTSIK